MIKDHGVPLDSHERILVSEFNTIEKSTNLKMYCPIELCFCFSNYHVSFQGVCHRIISGEADPQNLLRLSQMQA